MGNELKMETVKEIALPNGLRLTLHDCSRKVAGDRWYIALLARIPVAVEEADFRGQEEDASLLFKEFVEKNGAPEVAFELKKERNFIDEREREAVFQKMLEEIEGHVLSYLGHPGFAEGIKRTKLKEFMERRNWWKE